MNIVPSELIHRKEFFKGPVDDTFKEIENISTSKIVLKGEGTGKSTLLYYMQDKKANTEQPFICLDFYKENLYSNAIDLFPTEFIEHYWERVFTRKILCYIKEYYVMTYYSDFSKYNNLINIDKQKIDNLLNCIADNGKNCLPKMYSSKEICGEIIDKLKKIMHIESIELGIDSFDSINYFDKSFQNAKLKQKILSSYFDLFDKTIITANDEDLPEEWYKTYFNENSELFTFVSYNIEYGQYLEIIYSIIEKRVNEYNFLLYEKCKIINHNYKPFPLDWLDYDALKLLRNKTNGNIKLILDIINKLIVHWEKNGYIITPTIERIIEDRTFNRSLKKIFVDSKFYL